MLEFSLNRSASEPLNVLVLGAHADDIEIGCGGTLLRLIDDFPNMSVSWVVFSGSEKRRREARTAAEKFAEGSAELEVNLHSFRDGYFPWEGDRIKDVFEQLKEDLSPDLILTHCRDDAHQDHRQLCQLTWNTWRDHTILEYEIPKYDGDLGRPNLFVPLTEAVAKKKAALLLECFGSQRSRQWFSEDVFLSLMRLRGMECRAPEGFAEAFYGRKIRM